MSQGLSRVFGTQEMLPLMDCQLPDRSLLLPSLYSVRAGVLWTGPGAGCCGNMFPGFMGRLMAFLCLR